MQVSQELLDHIRAENAARLEWQNAAPGRVAGFSPEEPEFWAERGVYTLADLERWRIESTISDLHKEAFGYRPRGYDFASMTLEDLVALYDEWAEAARAEAEREQEQEKARCEEFENQIEQLREMGAPDRETALRWYFDGCGYDAHELNDPGYVCYLQGLPSSYADEFRPILGALLNETLEAA